MPERKPTPEEIVRGIRAHIAAAHDHMTVFDSKSEVTENVQYQLDEALKLLALLEVTEPELVPE